MCTRRYVRLDQSCGGIRGDALLRANCRRIPRLQRPEVLFTRTFHGFYIRRRVLRISIRLLRFFSFLPSFFFFKFEFYSLIVCDGNFSKLIFSWITIVTVFFLSVKLKTFILSLYKTLLGSSTFFKKIFII